MKRISGFVVSVLGSAAVWAQAQPVYPVPVPGGTVFPPELIHLFFPGIGPGFDGQFADPLAINNFKGVAAMGYTVGTATDGEHMYTVLTDIRVYQGDYIGAQSTFNGGGTAGVRAHGTFVEI